MFNKIFKISFAFLFFFQAVLLGLTPAPTFAAGAILFLSPSSGSVAVGKSFTVKVMVDSGGGNGINAAEGVIKYDPAYVLASSVSKSGSIFSLWTSNGGEGPGYSNTAGNVTFGGGAPGAYKGKTGTIFSVTFSAKKAGTAEIKFTSGIVLAADGKGTDIYSGSGSAKITITEAAVKTEAKPETKPETKKEETSKGILPPTPEVSSLSHEDENKWYANNQPEFAWKILSDLIGISYNISAIPTADPGMFAESISESKKFDDIADGVQYFHIKFKNKYGWGQPAHKKFLVDATPPEAFKITLDNGGDNTNPTPKLHFTSTDKASGIESYNVITNKQPRVVKPEEVAGGYYQTEALAPGEYNIDIVAIDKAQNKASSSITFIIDPLRAPIITSVPKVASQEELIIRGTSFYPQIAIRIYIAQSGKEAQEYSVMTDDNGNWSYFHKGMLSRGNYEVWAKAVDMRGAQSSDTTREAMTITSPSIIGTYGLYIIIFLLVVVVGLIMYIFYIRKNFQDEKRRIMRETGEMKDKTRKIFYALREEADELIELTDRKPGLSENERRVKEKVREALDIAEEFINKEVEDIEKEIKLKEKSEK